MKSLTKMIQNQVCRAAIKLLIKAIQKISHRLNQMMTSAEIRNDIETQCVA